MTARRCSTCHGVFPLEAFSRDRMRRGGLRSVCKACARVYRAAYRAAHVEKERAWQAAHRTPEYYSWRSMIQRTTNPKAPNWKYYGGRGIAVCERWTDFDNFLADMGPRPAGKSIDRFPDNDGNYEPSNCRWATPKEQRANQRAPTKKAA